MIIKKLITAFFITPPLLGSMAFLTFLSKFTQTQIVCLGIADNILGIHEASYFLHLC
jgi:hypothetical protein